MHVYSKYTLKNKKGITVANAFQKISDESQECKPNKIWLNKGSKFYSKSLESQLQDNDTERYSAHNEKRSILAEKCTRPLRTNFTNRSLQYQKMCILIN